MQWTMHTGIAALSVLGILQGPPPPPRLPPPATFATSSATQPVSPVALMTWVTRYGHDGVHALQLVVIWRGQPGWYTRGTSGGTSGGGSGTAFHHTVRYGGVELQLTFDMQTRVAEVQKTRVDLGDDNVILVDDVDSAGGPRVVETLRLDATLPLPQRGIPMVAPLLGQSPHVLAFLRCDGAQATVDALCAQVRPPVRLP